MQLRHQNTRTPECGPSPVSFPLLRLESSLSELPLDVVGPASTVICQTHRRQLSNAVGFAAYCRCSLESMAAILTPTGGPAGELAA